VKQSLDYESITEYLINQIKKTFIYQMDIGTVLETLKVLEYESIQAIIGISLSMDEDIKMAVDKPFEIEFKCEFDVFAKRKYELEMNISNASSFLWDQFARSLQSKFQVKRILNLLLKEIQCTY
jgi:hypothetical protein